MARDITEQKRLERQLDQAAHYDSLTGLPNRALIRELLKNALAGAKRQRTRLAVLFLDLDGFKGVNDSLGHEAGDSLLAAVAQRLRQAIREGDHVGRLSGDEFLVVLQYVGDSDDAQRVAEKIRALIKQPFGIKGQTVQIGTSIGIGMYPDDGDEMNALIHAADLAMYQGKPARDGNERQS